MYTSKKNNNNNNALYLYKTLIHYKTKHFTNDVMEESHPSACEISWLHLTTLTVFLMGACVPSVQRPVDALMRSFFQWVQVIQDLVIIKAPAGPVHIHPVAKDNTKEGKQKTCLAFLTMGTLNYRHECKQINPQCDGCKEILRQTGVGNFWHS